MQIQGRRREGGRNQAGFVLALHLLFNVAVVNICAPGNFRCICLSDEYLRGNTLLIAGNQSGRLLPVSRKGVVGQTPNSFRNARLEVI